MKARIIISVLTIMLLASIQFIFLSGIPTNSQQDDSDCNS